MLLHVIPPRGQEFEGPGVLKYGGPEALTAYLYFKMTVLLFQSTFFKALSH